MENIAWIGLGHMGIPMAKNLIKGGFDLSVYNRTENKTKPLVELGATVYKSVSEIVNACEIIFVMLSDDNATNAVFDEILKENIVGKLIVNMSTISVGLTKELSEKTIARSGKYLEAPVSGSVKPATEGTLIILAGGDEDDYDAVIPYFEKLGKLSLLLGEVGQGAKAKLAINFYMSVVIQGLAETVLFAEKNDIDKETMMLIVNESACASGMSKMKTPSILQENYPAAFPLKHMMKDIGLAHLQGLNTKMWQAVSQAYSNGMDMNLGDEDLMAVIKALKV